MITLLALHDRAFVGHLRVAVTPEEFALIPAGCAVNDAGPAGPERKRRSQSGPRQADNNG